MEPKVATRKSISKKMRFEVLKRDKFTCQYCGKQAPDVVLQIDHIVPVAKGGNNDITNLITSCWDCNIGKGCRELSDDSTVKKQKKQLDMLQERRLQLEMMRDWQLELTEEYVTEASIVSDVVKKLSGNSLTEAGIRDANGLVRQFGLELVCECVRIAFEKYSNNEMAWSKVGGICWCRTHTTCYDCKNFNGRLSSGEIDCPGSEEEPVYSVKFAPSCDLFEEKDKES